MFVGVVVLRYHTLITECQNSHKHSQSPLTSISKDRPVKAAERESEAATWQTLQEKCSASPIGLERNVCSSPCPSCPSVPEPQL